METTPQSPPRVLVVDDEPDITKLFSKFLKRTGYHQIEIAGNADEAFAIVPKFLPDVIVLDYKMEPGASGLSAACAIRDLYGIPSVLVTAFADTLAQEQDSHTFEVVKKPIKEATELHRAIETALELDASNPTHGGLFVGTDLNGIILGGSRNSKILVGDLRESKTPAGIKEIIRDEDLQRFVRLQKETLESRTLTTWQGHIYNPSGERFAAQVAVAPVCLGDEVVGLSHSIHLLDDENWNRRNQLRIDLLTKKIKGNVVLSKVEEEQLSRLQIEAAQRISAARDLDWQTLLHLIQNTNQQI